MVFIFNIVGVYQDGPSSHIHSWFGFEKLENKKGKKTFRKLKDLNCSGHFLVMIMNSD